MIQFLFLILLSLSHDGHHHDSGTIAPPKGGTLRSLESVHLELLKIGKTVRIFIYDKDLKSVATSNYPVSATIALPGKSPTPLKLTAKSKHWEYEYELKESHRYLLNFKIEQDDHKDTIKWNIER